MIQFEVDVAKRESKGFALERGFRSEKLLSRKKMHEDRALCSSAKEILFEDWTSHYCQNLGEK